MFNKLPLSDTQNLHHSIAETSSVKAVYITPHTRKICVKKILKLDITIAVSQRGGPVHQPVVLKWLNCRAGPAGIQFALFMNFPKGHAATALSKQIIVN